MHRSILVLLITGVLAAGIVIGALLDGSPADRALAASPKCSKASLAGAYGVTFNGHSENLGRFASVSLWKFNGRGGLEAAETFSSESTGPSTRKLTGRYVIKADCSFRLLFPSELGDAHEAVGACVLVGDL